jgi:hypothetical protein
MVGAGRTTITHSTHASGSAFKPQGVVVTPAGFLAAIGQGTDVSAADKATIDAQISSKQIKVYVFNSQNSTPGVAVQVTAAKSGSIPVVAVTEALTRPTPLSSSGSPHGCSNWRTRCCWPPADERDPGAARRRSVPRRTGRPAERPQRHKSVATPSGPAWTSRSSTASSYGPMVRKAMGERARHWHT